MPQERPAVPVVGHQQWAAAIAPLVLHQVAEAARVLVVVGMDDDMCVTRPPAKSCTQAIGQECGRVSSRKRRFFGYNTFDSDNDDILCRCNTL